MVITFTTPKYPSLTSNNHQDTHKNNINQDWHQYNLKYETFANFKDTASWPCLYKAMVTGIDLLSITLGVICQHLTFFWVPGFYVTDVHMVK